MTALAAKIAAAKVEPGTLAIYWLAQAGFVFKSSGGKVVYIDPYFSDVVERRFGFKRMMSCPIAAEDVEADIFLCTHEHLDHMDTDALPPIAKKKHTHFAGPIECVKEFRKIGIPEDRCHLLEEGQRVSIEGVDIHAVFADHGKLAPDALGIVMDFGDVKVYHTGDTAYRPEEFAPAIAMRPDVLLPCINGRYGNMDAAEAALLTQSVNPKVAIPSHFWMFVEHNGEPGRYIEQCTQLVPAVKVMLTKPGEEFLFRKG
jgi:L-ascorbate 6-phosphate lactonase